MEFTITTAIAFVGSVATVCLTIWKIVGMRKDSQVVSLTDFNDVKQQNAVQQNQIDELKSDVERLQNSLDKLNDLLIQFLTGNQG